MGISVDIDNLFQRFIDEPPEIFERAIADMSDIDRAFFNGYVVGYSQGSLHAQAAIDDDMDKEYPINETPPETARG